MIKINSLIIGQGIAGSMVAFMLQRKGLSVMVVDSGKKNTASRIAVGMFSSISGKRKTFNAEMIIKQRFAMDTYQQIEKLLKVKLLHQENIRHIFHDELERIETTQRKGDEKWMMHIDFHPNPIDDIKAEHGAIEIKNSGWLHCELFVDTYKDYLSKNQSYTTADFSYNELEISHDTIRFRDFEALNIIFCEGYQAKNNPFFKEANIIPCKGDVLTLQHTNKGNKDMLKRNGGYLIPLNDDTIKAGSTYLWNNDDEQLRPTDSNVIKNKIDNILGTDYKIINHQSAIRPTTQNREVIAIQHPQYKNMFMLNGLGTKGVVQAPYWAQYISDIVEKS